MSSKDLHLFRLIGDPLARFCEILSIESMPTGTASGGRRTGMAQKKARRLKEGSLAKVIIDGLNAQQFGTLQKQTAKQKRAQAFVLGMNKQEHE